MPQPSRRLPPIPSGIANALEYPARTYNQTSSRTNDSLFLKWVYHKLGRANKHKRKTLNRVEQNKLWSSHHLCFMFYVFLCWATDSSENPFADWITMHGWNFIRIKGAVVKSRFKHCHHPHTHITLRCWTFQGVITVAISLLFGLFLFRWSAVLWYCFVSFNSSTVPLIVFLDCGLS